MPVSVTLPILSNPVQSSSGLIRSDDLPKFAAVLRRISGVNDRTGVFQVDLILDANVVISDLLWLARRRVNPESRTMLMEVMDCGVVRSHAPFFLAREINRHLPILADEHAIDLSNLRTLWRHYRKRIHFVAVGGPSKKLVDGDPKDAPYIRLQRKLAHPIVSNDTDIQRMGGGVVRIQVFGPLRAYSRSAAVEYQFKVNGAISAIVLTGILEGGAALAKQLPKQMLCGGALIMGLLLLHPDSRTKLLGAAADLVIAAMRVFEATHEIVAPMFTAHDAARKDALYNLSLAKQELAACVCPSARTV